MSHSFFREVPGMVSGYFIDLSLDVLYLIPLFNTVYIDSRGTAASLKPWDGVRLFYCFYLALLNIGPIDFRGTAGSLKPWDGVRLFYCSLHAIESRALRFQGHSCQSSNMLEHSYTFSYISRKNFYEYNRFEICIKILRIFYKIRFLYNSLYKKANTIQVN